jgi:hypothetical protein
MSLFETASSAAPLWWQRSGSRRNWSEMSHTYGSPNNAAVIISSQSMGGYAAETRR